MKGAASAAVSFVSALYEPSSSNFGVRAVKCGVYSDTLRKRNQKAFSQEYVLSSLPLPRGPRGPYRPRRVHRSHGRWFCCRGWRDLSVDQDFARERAFRLVVEEAIGRGSSGFSNGRPLRGSTDCGALRTTAFAAFTASASAAICFELSKLPSQF